FAVTIVVAAAAVPLAEVAMARPAAASAAGTARRVRRMVGSESGNGRGVVPDPSTSAGGPRRRLAVVAEEPLADQVLHEHAQPGADGHGQCDDPDERDLRREEDERDLDALAVLDHEHEREDEDEDKCADQCDAAHLLLVEAVVT